jgi:hypothetical protein
MNVPDRRAELLDERRGVMTLLRSSVHFFGPVIFKYFASTRLIASVTHPRTREGPARKRRTKINSGS